MTNKHVCGVKDKDGYVRIKHPSLKIDVFRKVIYEDGLTLRVESTGSDLETLKLHTEYYRNMYSKHIYKRKALVYRVRVVPSSGFKMMDVRLVSARGEERVVGRFKTAREASDFIDMYYGEDNPFRLPVYSVNADTKAFLLDMQTELLDIK